MKDHSIFTFIIILASIAFVAPYANADEAKTRFPVASDVTKATVILAQLGTMTRKPLTEEDLIKGTNCSFSTNDERQISTIVSILRSNSVEKPDGVGRIDLRNIVYLTLSDGSRVRFMYGQPSQPANEVYGGMDSGRTGSYVPLISNITLVNNLRDWALEIAGPDASKRPCLIKAKN